MNQSNSTVAWIAVSVVVLGAISPADDKTIVSDPVYHEGKYPDWQEIPRSDSKDSLGSGGASPLTPRATNRQPPQTTTCDVTLFYFPVAVIAGGFAAVCFVVLFVFLIQRRLARDRQK